jgi:hypothetical protein
MGDGVLAHRVQNGVFVAQVNLFENVFGIAGDVLEVFQVARVSEAIEIDEAADVWFVNNMMNEIGTDEAGAAGDEEIHKSWV